MNGLSLIGGVIFGLCGFIGIIFLIYTIIAWIAGWSFGLGFAGPMSILFFVGIAGLMYLNKLDKN